MQSERLHELSLGAKMVADRGAVLALFASLLDERVVSVRTSRLNRPVVLRISRTGLTSPAKTLDGTGRRASRLLDWRPDGPFPTLVSNRFGEAVTG